MNAKITANQNAINTAKSELKTQIDTLTANHASDLATVNAAIETLKASDLSFEDRLAAVEAELQKMNNSAIIKVEIIDGYLWVAYAKDPETPVNVGKVTQNTALHDGTDGLEFFPLPDGSYAACYGNTIYLEEIVFPSKYNGKPVTAIVHHDRISNTVVKSIVIPNSIISIGNEMFFGFTSLESITIPSSVTSIGKNAFSGCTGLMSVIFMNTSGWRADGTSISSAALADAATAANYLKSTYSAYSWSRT